MRLRCLIVALPLLWGRAAAGAAPIPASITIAGGVSLGAYEAGFGYYAVEFLRANAWAAQLALATGASAGSVNAFLALLEGCGAAAPDPRQSIFFKAWIPLGLEDLTRPGETPPTAAFSRAAFEAPLELIRSAFMAGLSKDCDVVYGLSVTRLDPRPVWVKAHRLQLPRVEDHFVVRIRGRGFGMPPLLTNYADPRWEGDQSLLPENEDGEVSFPALVDALFASTAFPGAFPPQEVHHCVVRGGGSWSGCPEASARGDLFVDGGVFDNMPIQLAAREAAAGLAVEGERIRWADRPDLRRRQVPSEMSFAYLSTEVQTFPPPARDAEGEEPRSILGVATRVGEAFFESARAKNLLYLYDQDPEFFEGLIIAERHLPAASSPLAAFFGFFETALREFDFTLGMYDARRLGEARVLARFERAGRAGPLRLPEKLAGDSAAESWQPYHCLSAVLDDPPAAEAACRGEALRDFRIVLQTSIERLWDRCASPEVLKTAFAEDQNCRAAAEGQPPVRVPGVAPLPDNRWRRNKGESDTAYSLRLLAGHEFEFKDLGLRPDQAGAAPVLLRERLLAIGRQVSRSQPGAQASIVEAAMKLAADQVTYVPPRHTAWVLVGRELEAGLSGGFIVDRRLIGAVRFHAALQLNNLGSMLSSEHGSPAFSALGGIEVLPASLATSALQPSLIVRGGVLLSAGDGYGSRSCPEPTSTTVGSCSRPALGAGVAATVLERFRLQVMWNYYFPTQAGNVAWWVISPGFGLQWVF